MGVANMVKLSNHFFGGLLVGAALAAMLVGSLAYTRIEENRKFSDENMHLLITALKDIDALKSACGDKCSGIKVESINAIDKNL